MKLKLKPKASSKTKDTKATAKKKEKEDKKYKSKFYTDTKEFKFLELDVTVNNLRYNHIMYCNITKLNLMGDIIDINDSWTGLILMMLDTIRVNHENNFREYLMEKEITDQDFCVDKYFGKYNFKKEYTAYNLYDSGYFVESSFDYTVVYKVLINMAKALNIDPELMSFHLVNKDNNYNKVRLDELKDESTSVNIDEALPYFKEKVHLMDVMVCNTSEKARKALAKIRKENKELGREGKETKEVKDMYFTKTHNIQELLMIFLYNTYDIYGERTMSKLTQIEGKTFLRTTSNLDESPSMQIRNSKFFVYSDVEPESILKFISNCMEILGMDKDDVKLYFRRYKKQEEKKEWEVD